MSLFLFIMEVDRKKLITCIKEQYDLIMDQIRRTFSHVLDKVHQSQPMSHCHASLASFSSRKTIISASSLNMLQVLRYWMFCQSAQMLLKKPKPTTIYLQNSTGHNISMSDPRVQLEAFKLPQPQS